MNLVKIIYFREVFINSWGHFCYKFHLYPLCFFASSNKIYFSYTSASFAADVRCFPLLFSSFDICSQKKLLNVFINCWVSMDHCKIDGKDPAEDKKPKIMQGQKQSIEILEWWKLKIKIFVFNKHTRKLKISSFFFNHFSNCLSHIYFFSWFAVSRCFM